MTRVISGHARGRRLSTPAGSTTRPTSDRVREALFSSLESALSGFDGAIVLDLFAGSGAVGLEALSRGAEGVVLVESDQRAAAVIRANVAAVGLPGATVVTAKVESYLQRPPDHRFDVVFLDPPYDLPAADVTVLLGALADPRWSKANGWIVVERSSRDRDFAWPTTIGADRESKYGETVLWYGRPHA